MFLKRPSCPSYSFSAINVIIHSFHGWMSWCGLQYKFLPYSFIWNLWILVLGTTLSMVLEKWSQFFIERVVEIFFLLIYKIVLFFLFFVQTKKSTQHWISQRGTFELHFKLYDIKNLDVDKWFLVFQWKLFVHEILGRMVYRIFKYLRCK